MKEDITIKRLPKNEITNELSNVVVQEGYNISKGTVYLGLNEFLWTVALLIGLLSGLLGIVWRSIQTQITKTSIADKAIYDKMEHLRIEIKEDVKDLNNKLWDLK